MLGMLESEPKLNILSAQELTRFFQQNKIQHIISYLQYQKFLSFIAPSYLNAVLSTNNVETNQSEEYYNAEFSSNKIPEKMVQK